MRSKNVILFNRIVVTASASGCEMVKFICALKIKRRSIFVVLKYEILWSFVFEKFSICSVVEFANFKWEKIRIGIIKI